MLLNRGTAPNHTQTTKSGKYKVDQISFLAEISTYIRFRIICCSILWPIARRRVGAGGAGEGERGERDGGGSGGGRGAEDGGEGGTGDAGGTMGAAADDA